MAGQECTIGQVLLRLSHLYIGLGFLCVVSATASAHVGSSEKVNNRYYKITPMADRVRLAYTIFFGREPGMVIRRRMDKNRDGQISPKESKAYAQLIEGEIHKSVSVALDGAAFDIRWRDVDIGLGKPNTAGGPFSLDFIGTVCLASKAWGLENRLVFRDRMRLPKPGETELFLDPAPGIRVIRSEMDGREVRTRGEKWQGGPGPAQKGYQLSFVVESDETAGLDSACDPPKKNASMRLLWIGLFLGAGLVGAGLLLWRGRRSAVPERS